MSFFGVELPVIQAPMAGAHGSELTIAVSNAGGLGSLPCAMLTPAQIRQELTAIQTGTAGPYNVNFFCHRAPKAAPEREAAWRAALAPYYAEYGIDVNSIPPAPTRGAFNEEALAVIEEFRPPVVSFHFGLPDPRLLAAVKATGALVISSATSVDEARWLEARGIDAIIAQGVEAGGHRGMFLSHDVATQVGTFALVPQIVEAVAVPVIAAGGVADARGVAAAFALGAVAVQAGTAYLLCPETQTTALHRKALKGESARHTALTNVFTGRPARGIVNRVMRELGPMSPVAPEFPLAGAALAPLRAKAEAAGASDFSPLWAGQNVTGCIERPAAEVTRALAEGA